MVGTGNSQFSGQVVLRGHSAECLLNILATGPTLFPQGYRKSRFQHRTQSTRHQCAPLSSYNLESRIGKGGSSSPTRGKSISVQVTGTTVSPRSRCVSTNYVKSCGMRFTNALRRTLNFGSSFQRALQPAPYLPLGPFLGCKISPASPLSSFFPSNKTKLQKTFLFLP